MLSLFYIKLKETTPFSVFRILNETSNASLRTTKN